MLPLLIPQNYFFSCSLGNLTNADSFSELTKKKKSNFHLSGSEVRSAEKKTVLACVDEYFISATI